MGLPIWLCMMSVFNLYCLFFLSIWSVVLVYLHTIIIAFIYILNEILFLVSVIVSA